MSSERIERLVAMANDIANFFAAEPEGEVAVEGVRNHLRRYWEPRMRHKSMAAKDSATSRARASRSLRKRKQPRLRRGNVVARRAEESWTRIFADCTDRRGQEADAIVRSATIRMDSPFPVRYPRKSLKSALIPRPGPFSDTNRQKKRPAFAGRFDLKQRRSLIGNLRT